MPQSIRKTDYDCVYSYGRKQTCIVFNFFGGFACILSCLVRGNGFSAWAGRTALVTVARMSFAGSACSFFVWAAELYPTTIRANGFGVCMFALRLGGALAPQLLALVRKNKEKRKN